MFFIYSASHRPFKRNSFLDQRLEMVVRVRNTPYTYFEQGAFLHNFLSSFLSQFPPILSSFFYLAYGCGTLPFQKGLKQQKMEWTWWQRWGFFPNWKQPRRVQYLEYFRSQYFDYGLTPDVLVRVTEEVSTLQQGNTTPCKPCRTTGATNPISSGKLLLSSARDLTLAYSHPSAYRPLNTPRSTQSSSFYVRGQTRSHIRSI